jgi:hypothetical protein
MANSFQTYALALLTLVGNQEDLNDNSPLGIATRRDATDSSSSNMPAHSVVRFPIEHSPSPETIARLFKFIAELARGEIPAVKNLGNALSTLRDTFHVKHYMQVNTLNSSGRSVSPGDWATAVQAGIRQTDGIMKPLTDLASFSLTCLVIGCRVPWNLY